MIRTLAHRSFAAAVLSIAVAGCALPGASATKETPTVPATALAGATAKPTVKPTPVSITPAMTAYGQSLDPVLRAGIRQANAIIGLVGKGNIAFFGKTCATYGGYISQNLDSFHSVPFPPQAKTLERRTVTSYKHLLGATDECGIAADEDSSGAMAASRKDMETARKELQGDELTLHTWATKH